MNEQMKILASLAVTFCWGKDINIVNKSYKILEVISAMVKKKQKKLDRIKEVLIVPERRVQILIRIVRIGLIEEILYLYTFGLFF